MQVHPVVQNEITSKMEDILENVILGPIGSKVTHTHTHTFLKWDILSLKETEIEQLQEA